MKIEPNPLQEKIIQTLENYLLGPENGLNRFYHEIYAYSNRENLNVSSAKLKELREPYQSYFADTTDKISTLAIDLPVFLKGHQDNKKTIIICALDPLPPLPEDRHWDGKNFIQGKDVSVWVPFSLCDDWNNPTGSMVTNIPFFREILNQFHIYVTDIFKLFFRTGENPKYVSSNQIPRYTELSDYSGNNIHGKILSEEIKIIRPEAIVTLGNRARNGLLRINELENGISQAIPSWGDDVQEFKWGNNIKIVSIPHISGSANGSKSKILKNPKYQAIPAKYQNEKMARVVLQNLIH